MQTPDVSKVQRTYTTHSLVITYKYLYIVREDYILWPLPTFGIGPSTRPQFEIIHSLPVSGRISGIQVRAAALQKFQNPFVLVLHFASVRLVSRKNELTWEVVTFQMYDTDTYLHGNDGLPENFMATGPASMTHFIGFGVRSADLL